MCELPRLHRPPLKSPRVRFIYSESVSDDILVVSGCGNQTAFGDLGQKTESAQAAEIRDQR